MRTAFALLLVLVTALSLAACSGTPEIRERVRTVEVKVPVPTYRAPPPELATPPALAAPRFVPPSDAQASSALTPQGEAVLRALIGELLARERAWREWARGPPDESDNGGSGEGG